MGKKKKKRKMDGEEELENQLTTLVTAVARLMGLRDKRSCEW